MKNQIIRFLGYTIGSGFIYSIIPNIGFKEFCIVTLGVLIIVYSTILFPYNNN